MKSKGLSLHVWAILIVLTVTLTLFSAQMFINYRYTNEVSEQNSAIVIQNINANLPEMLAWPLTVGNEQDVRNIVGRMVKNDYIYSIQVFNLDGSLIVRSDNPAYNLNDGLPPIKTYEFDIVDSRVPINLSPAGLDDENITPNKLATVKIQSTTAKVTAESRAELNKRSYLFAGVVLGLVASLYLLIKGAHRQSRQIVDALQRIDSGDYASLLSRNTPFKDFNNIANHVISLSENLKEAKETADQQRDAAEEANNLKDRFISTASHEIRDPVNSVSGMIDIIVKMTDSGNDQLLKEHLKVCQASSNALRSVVNEFLDFAYLESGKEHTELLPFNPYQLFDSLSVGFSSRFRLRKIQFNVMYTGVRLFKKMIISDEKKLHIILGNLLSNAAKYTEKGRVDLKWKIENQLLLCKVSDTGVGIASDEISRIFDRFYQVERQEIRHKKGWGIGLAIVKKLTEMLDGTIEVQSEPAVGSIFRIRIPVEVGHPFPDSKRENHSGKRELKALVVDDNSSNCYMMKLLLEDAGIEAVTEKSSANALKRARNEDFDIFFLDYHLPGQDGISLAHDIKKLPSLRNQTMICISADTKNSAREKILSGGIFDNLLIKPVMIDDVVAMIDRIVQARQLTDHSISKLQRASD